MNYFLKMFYLFAMIVTIFINSCAEKEFDPTDAKKSFAIAKEPFDSGRYEDGIKRLSEFKSRFPYSQFTPEAELLIADSQFKLDRFQEAAATYDTFVKLHPKHPKVDFAMFRVGESYWQDAPEVVSREQEYTQKAITQWKDLIARFPNSEYSKQASKLVEDGTRRIAESVRFVARFYCKQEIWHACAYRYIKLLERFPQYKDISDEALESAANALDKVAEAKDADPESDKNLFHRTMTSQQIREKAANFRKILKG
ncbi:MAG: outer membrane protein assembly factor BamD [Proteobacteria bacterium]|nr:outer membrane protein assembly factor BamD [Pseudomonadota bacterium]